jgi:hypothetical protein
MEEYGRVCDVLMSTYARPKFDPLRTMESTQHIPVVLLRIAHVLRSVGSSHTLDFAQRLLRLTLQVCCLDCRMWLLMSLFVARLLWTKPPLPLADRLPCTRPPLPRHFLSQMIVEAQRVLLGCDGVPTGPVGLDVAALLPAIAECIKPALGALLDPSPHHPAPPHVYFTRVGVWIQTCTFRDVFLCCVDSLVRTCSASVCQRCRACISLPAMEQGIRDDLGPGRVPVAGRGVGHRTVQVL